MKISLGVGLHWRDMSLDEFLELIYLSESLGYEYLWVTNEKFFRDMYVISGMIAMRTEQPYIGTFVSDPYTHHPALTAMAIATLDEVSRGRAILCIGAGGTGFPAMGISRNKPVKAVRETIHLTRALLQGEVVDFQGEVIQFHRGQLNFRPRPDIPIIVATRGDQMLQAAGELANGVMIATYAEPEGIRCAIDLVEKGVRRAGRKLNDLELFSRVDACISSDRRAAIEAVKPMVGIFLWTSYPDRKFVHRVGLEVPEELERIIAKRDYNLVVANSHLVPDSFVDKFCWAGTPEDVASKVAAIVAIGINNITILPHPPEGGTIVETVREFALSVGPMEEETLH